MKKISLPIYLFLILITTSVVAFTYIQRKFILPSQTSNNMQVDLVWLAYDANHVAIEYDVIGNIQTSYGNYGDCPIGKSVVVGAVGQDITGEIYTSCRFISENRYSVTQFFYNDFQNRKPQKVKIQIGDVAFFSPESNKEIYIPVLKTFIFDLSKQAESTDIAARPNETVRAHGIDMALEKAEFTPRAVKIDACLTLPDNGDWGVDASLIMGAQSFPITYWEIPNYRNAKALQSQKRCFTFLIADARDYREFKTGDISFTAHKIYRNMPDCVDSVRFNKIKDELSKYGINPKPDTTGEYCFANEIVNLGDVDANAHLFGYIQAALKEEVAGPLTITVK